MSGGIQIEMHPLVVMNISDHLTRSRYQQPNKNVRAVGTLLGRQEGRVLEIENTLELAFSEVPKAEGSIKIDEGFCFQRLEQYKKMFPDLDCVGWYSAQLRDSQDTPTEADGLVHKRFLKFTENPMMLIMNPDSKDARESKKMPFFLYEVPNQSSGNQVFEKLDYNLATSDSERIAVDNVAKAIDPNARNSNLSQNLQSSLNSIQILRKRVKVLIDLVTNSPQVRENQDFMRRLNQIVAQLPITQREHFEKTTFSEYSDIAALNVLSSITKSYELMSQFQEDFKVLKKGGPMQEYGIGDQEMGVGYSDFGDDADMMEYFSEMRSMQMKKMMGKMSKQMMFQQ